MEPRAGPMRDAKIRRVKTSFDRDLWDSAKERGLQGYAFANTQKADFSAVAIVKFPWI
jgi:very-short-patch-repair endonuclease